MRPPPHHPGLDRRRFLLISLAGALAAPLAAEAQQASKMSRIGFLSPLAGPSPPTEAFLQGLRDLGYVEGQSIVIEYRWAGRSFDQAQKQASELVNLKVDVIFAPAPPSTQAAKEATRTIPIVFAVSGDPVAEGLVASLGQPGGNITGLTSIGSDVIGKQMEMLRDVVPKLTRVAVLENPNNHAHPRMVRQAEEAVRVMGLQLQILKARNPAEIEGAFGAVANQRATGVIVLRDSLFFDKRTHIESLAGRGRLPTVAGYREGAEAGALIAYGASLADSYRRAAIFVDRILKGAKPGDLPIEQPTKFELVINLKTAKALGLTIPPSLLARADQVIE
jgi:putative tryptophan/tyrosine transport system substrate-binding protein